MQDIVLNNGAVIPQLGFGVYMSQAGEECENAVRWALEAGYRHIDTAKAYNNEESVGLGIRESGVAREDIFLTTKLWNEDVRQRNARQACEDSLRRLGTDYLDLYLIHWPAESYVEAWQEMEKLQDEGKCRAIGVSNFDVFDFELAEEDMEANFALGKGLRTGPDPETFDF
ncbi:MAG: aldo/keto reductase [Atopobiaceae bacterium]|nr:aldo/keto reductase [Atopobiaceae bacterium]